MSGKAEARVIGRRGVGGAIGRLKTRAIGAARDVRDAIEARREAAVRATPSVADRQADLIQFYAQYEDLVDTLCSAAQYGPTASLEARYRDGRQAMQSSYPAMRKSVVAFLQYDSADAAHSFELHGRSGDAFEALFAAPTLEEFLRCDDGRMIDRIERTRYALSLYADYLRKLASTS